MNRARMVVARGAALFAVTGPTTAGGRRPVGHTVKRIEVPGTAANEIRAVDVRLWYPADPASATTRPKTVHRSALHEALT